MIEPNDDRIITLDPQLKICAEMYRNEAGLYSFVCYYCGRICGSFEAIDAHISNNHFSDGSCHNKTCTEICDDIKIEVDSTTNAWTTTTAADDGMNNSSADDNANEAQAIISIKEEEPNTLNYIPEPIELTKCQNNSNEIGFSDESSHDKTYARICDEIKIEDNSSCIFEITTMTGRDINNSDTDDANETEEITPLTAEWQNEINFESEYLDLVNNLSEVQCDKCSEIFASKKNLKNHMIVHARDKQFNCKINKGLRFHMQHHTRKKVQYKCNICTKILDSEENLMDHKRTHHTSSEIPYSCKICGKCFIWSDSLTRHSKDTHKDENPQTFTSKTILEDTTIVQIHTGKKPYENLPNKLFKCNICSKTNKSQRRLREHMRMHSGEKPYSCKICEKGFTRSDTLARHLRIHTGENRDYKCNICFKIVTTKDSLRHHLQIHTGEKPFNCKFCEKSFALNAYLKVHMQIHSGEQQKKTTKPLKCDICSKRLSTKRGIRDHMLIHTGKKPFSCKICGKQFARKRYIKLHMQTHAKV